jgi:hypothetical protein
MLVSLAVVSCTPFKSLSPEELVTARVEGYWSAMKAGDYKSAYAFLAPGYRTQVSEEAFEKRFRGKTTFHKTSLTTVICETEVCDSVVNAAYTVHGAPPFNMDVDAERPWRQRWIQFEDEWWLLPK